ncbi:hypothetical protein [Nonomuraea sp. NPDC049480]|uniref:hypothetical protein n=1 Tax=Nonomuraea sp. NPDC049480 TaxID=3364353 RepID=UPI0037BDFA2F
MGELVSHAYHRVWTVTTPGPAPVTGRVVPALPEGAGMRYRVVAAAPPDPRARLVEPTLEDGYLALMDG